MNAFDFVAPSQIVFGWGRIAEIGAVVSSIGRRAFLVWGSRTLSGSDVGRKIIADLKVAGVSVVAIPLPPGEPEVATIDQLAEQVRAENPTRDDVVIGVGGGSGMDAGKAVAGLALDPDKASIKDFLEGVGTGRKIAWPVLPIVAVPTTAGTGSEATFNAVISSRNPPFKKSFRDHRLMPKVAIIDPQLACSAPKNVTAWAGMDALTQLIEAMISKKATEPSYQCAMHGLQQIRDAVRSIHHNPNDQEARTQLAYAAFQSGMALANGGLGLAHGVASALGALKGTPHGLACAVMLPAVMKVNCNFRSDSRNYGWQATVVMCLSAGRAHYLVNDHSQTSNPNFESDWSERAVIMTNSLLAELDIPSHLGDLGVTKADIPELVRLSQGSSLSGNPKPISEAELAALLESML